VGGCIYLPLEIYEIHAKASIVHVSALLINLVVVVLMGLVLLQKWRSMHS